MKGCDQSPYVEPSTILLSLSRSVGQWTFPVKLCFTMGVGIYPGLKCGGTYGIEPYLHICI